MDNYLEWMGWTGGSSFRVPLCFVVLYLFSIYIYINFIDDINIIIIKKCACMCTCMCVRVCACARMFNTHTTHHEEE